MSRAVKRYVRELRRQLSDILSDLHAEEWSFEPTNNGHLVLLVTTADSRKVRRYHAGTPSDHRATANFLAGVRRAVSGRGGEHG